MGHLLQPFDLVCTCVTALTATALGVVLLIAGKRRSRIWAAGTAGLALAALASVAAARAGSLGPVWAPAGVALLIGLGLLLQMPGAGAAAGKLVGALGSPGVQALALILAGVGVLLGWTALQDSRLA